jgi:hypothetical protein
MERVRLVRLQKISRMVVVLGHQQRAVDATVGRVGLADLVQRVLVDRNDVCQGTVHAHRFARACTPAALYEA